MYWKILVLLSSPVIVLAQKLPLLEEAKEARSLLDDLTWPAAVVAVVLILAYVTIKLVNKGVLFNGRNKNGNGNGKPKAADPSMNGKGNIADIESRLTTLIKDESAHVHEELALHRKETRETYSKMYDLLREHGERIATVEAKS